MIQATDGDFYGTTSNGGANGLFGTVFKITPSGTRTTIHSFCSRGDCRDGESPLAGVIQVASGDLYGTTNGGGANCCGTVFKINPNGALTTLYSFCSQGGVNCTDGAYPIAALVQSSEGDFYGATEWGGTNNNGTIFKITRSGRLTTLYRFCAQSGCPDGYGPQGALVQGTDGDFYGTTGYGGAGGLGTVFKITQGGTLTTLHSFAGEDGAQPSAGVIQATDGNFYGTTFAGGRYNLGTIFRIAPGSGLTTLQSFDGTHGAGPFAALVQATNGDFYGTTYSGGLYDDNGTVFRLSVGLGPFVETQTSTSYR